MHKFSNAEMDDMHFIYKLPNVSLEKAQRIYQDRYPDRVVPCTKTFRMLHARLCETGRFNKIQVPPPEFH